MILITVANKIRAVIHNWRHSSRAEQAVFIALGRLCLLSVSGTGTELASYISSSKNDDAVYRRVTLPRLKLGQSFLW